MVPADVAKRVTARAGDPDDRYRRRPGLRRAGAGLVRHGGDEPRPQAEVRQAVRRHGRRSCWTPPAGTPRRSAAGSTRTRSTPTADAPVPGPARASPRAGSTARMRIACRRRRFARTDVATRDARTCRLARPHVPTRGSRGRRAARGGRGYGGGGGPRRARRPRSGRASSRAGESPRSKRARRDRSRADVGRAVGDGRGRSVECLLRAGPQRRVRVAHPGRVPVQRSRPGWSGAAAGSCPGRARSAGSSSSP